MALLVATEVLPLFQINQHLKNQYSIHIIRVFMKFCYGATKPQVLQSINIHNY